MTPERWQQIEELYHAAQERGRGVLAGVAPDVRSEVERLLEQDSGDGFLDRPAAELFKDSTISEFAPGVQLGPYRIEARIDAGGMGEVFRATDTRLGRAVAVKTCREQFSERFHREARAISSLNHPHICTLHDVGPNYLVMELIEGETLAACLKRGKLSIEQTISYGAQIADALAAAQAKGIVHRDLKPGNIMLTESGVKVLDFGLAKSTQDEALTRSRVVMGTPAYMAPEQRDGKECDARTDIYALGLVLYEMATGKRWVSGARLKAELPADLARIVSKCLEQDRNLRYQHASDLRLDLQSLKTAKPRPHIAVLWSAIGIGAAALLVFFMADRVPLRGTPKLTDKDTLILAEFENRTGDPVFDGTLRQGLAVQLQQSPFLSLVPEERIQQTLHFMGQPPNARLTSQLAQDICERTASSAVLEGSIAPLGNQYVLGLHARNCRSGESLDDEQMQVAKKEDVLNGLGKIASNFRKRAGESLATIKQHDTPLAEATTPSLEALKAYSAGRRMIITNEDEAAALPLLKRTVEIDPNFAAAYEFLGRVYADIGESVLAAENISKAYELRDRASDAEKFSITTSYDVNVTGNLEKAQQICELWAQTYPREVNAHAALSAFIYQPFGNYEKSVEEAQKVVQSYPDAFYGYVNLAGSYLLLDRLPEAEKVLRQASERKVEHPFLVMERYSIAFLKNDEAAMEREVALSRGKGALEEWMSHAQSLTFGYFGRLQQARRMSEHAADLAQQVGQRETAALFKVEEALREAFFGNAPEARRNAMAALELSSGHDVEYGAGFALALARDSSRAQKIVNELERRFPEDTEVRSTYLPEIRALLALNDHKPSKAIELLQAAVPYELGTPPSTTIAFFGALYPAYVRGEAWLAARDGTQAAAEFQKILDHRGLVVNDPVGALARLQLGRASAMSGETAKAKSSYQDFLTLWKNADPDIPILKQAKAEYGDLR